MSDRPPPNDIRPSLLSLPLDIYVLLFEYLEPPDISRLCALSHASYNLFSSPVVCSYYLSRHGIFPSPQDTAKAEFDSYFRPRSRIRKGTPTRATIVDGLRLTDLDEPYFTKSHAYRSAGDNANRDGVVAYRTAAGDLALFDLSNPSNSTVLLINKTWEFTTQSLAEYNESGAGMVVVENRSIKERMPGGWWSAESFENQGIGMKKFQVNVHDDFGGEVLFIELSWVRDEKTTDPYDVVTLLSAAHTPLPSEEERTWYPIVARTKNLGLVISMKPENFGHPIAAFSLPFNKLPHTEYVLNSYYVAGIAPGIESQQFLFLRYSRDDMETVCAITGTRKEGHGSQLFWKLQEYLPAVVLISLTKMGLSKLFIPYESSSGLDSNSDTHLQQDRAGELVFIITGAGVTAFDISRMNQYGGLKVVKSYWWRHQDGMRVYAPPDEDLDGEAMERTPSWQRDASTRTRTGSDLGSKLIAPSVVRIWRSFLPGKVFGGGSGDDEMFTVVRGYNYVIRIVHGEPPLQEIQMKIPVWERPEFLVAWEIPLTRKGLEKYSSQMLNRRGGFQDSQDETPILDPDGNSEFPYSENHEGIYPTKIMRLQTALTKNLNSLWASSYLEPHAVLAVHMPQTSFVKENRHKRMPRLLKINDYEIEVEGDEFRELVGPIERGRWTPERYHAGLLKLPKRQERDILRINRGAELPCKWPCPQSIRYEKRRSVLRSMFRGKGENLQSSERYTAGAPVFKTLPRGNIHHVKVGDSGNYIAYVVKIQPEQRDPERTLSGSLVIARYD
ncbi:hypothetical protein TWF506_006048 [Arthrobotrys conoides]|uniref:F-box domain-containing protein n=1 Tax=Arthrobotrys conoides TaxID=74498 RepID=A0AAN8RNP5_9PEZI